jgi:hypothetical protein
MLIRLFRAILPTLLLLEAALAGLWIWNLLPGITGRGALTLALVTARGFVCVAQTVSSLGLRVGRPFAVKLTTATLLAAGVLLTCETGLRLAPTNLDPSFRWHVVVGYWVYVAVAFSTVRGTGFKMWKTR